MPGFRYCSWCNGKGCMCCDAEQAKWKKSHGGDIRKIKEQYEEGEFNRAMQGLPAVSLSEIDAALDPMIDAEYARQFPSGPIPIFTARIDNPKDMELLKSVFHRSKIEEAFGEGGGGMEQILNECEVIRAMQEPPINYQATGAPSDPD